MSNKSNNKLSPTAQRRDLGLSRREFLTAGIVGTGAATLAACGVNPTPQPTKAIEATSAIIEPTAAIKKEGTLTYWWWGEQNAPGMKNWMEETNRLYMEQNPGVKVDAVLQETNALYPAFAAAAQAKSGPDLIYRWDSLYLLEDVWKGNLAPISDYWTQEELSHNLTGEEGAGFDGKIWGAAVYGSGYVMTYNKTLFQKAGLDPENPPVTWEDFLSACQKLKSAGINPISLGTKDGWVGGWVMSDFAIQYLETLKDLLLAIAGDQKFTDPVHATPWENYEELAKNGYLNDDHASLTYQQGGREKFILGQTAMTFGLQVYSLQDEQSLGSNTVGAMLPPKVGNGKYSGGFPFHGSFACITSFSPNIALAADYLRYTHTTDRLNSLYIACHAYPGDTKFDTRLYSTSPIAKKMVDWIANKASPTWEDILPTAIAEEAVFDGVQRIASGDQTAKGAAEKVETAAQKWRDQNPDSLENFKKWAATTKG